MSCVVCNKQSVSVCSRCKSVNYCSVTCQRLDWSTHKESCTVFIPPKNEPIMSEKIAGNSVVTPSRSGIISYEKNILGTYIDNSLDIFTERFDGAIHDYQNDSDYSVVIISAMCRFINIGRGNTLDRRWRSSHIQVVDDELDFSVKDGNLGCVPIFLTTDRSFIDAYGLPVTELDAASSILC